MHKNINNSVIIESNLPKKKGSKAGFEQGVAKIGNYMVGFATNTSMISNNNNISMDKGSFNEGKKQTSSKIGSQKAAK